MRAKVWIILGFLLCFGSSCRRLHHSGFIDPKTVTLQNSPIIPQSPNTPKAPSVSPAQILFYNALPAPTDGIINIFVDGNMFVPRVAFRGYTMYLNIASGQHDISFRENNGAKPDLASLGQNSLAAGKKYSVVAMGNPSLIAPAVPVPYAFTLFDDTVAPAAAGNAMIRVINATNNLATSIDFSVSAKAPTAAPPAGQINFAQQAASGFISVPVGTGLSIFITATGTPATIYASIPFLLSSGQAATFVVTDGAQGANPNTLDYYINS